MEINKGMVYINIGIFLADMLNRACCHHNPSLVIVRPLPRFGMRGGGVAISRSSRRSTHLKCRAAHDRDCFPLS